MAWRQSGPLTSFPLPTMITAELKLLTTPIIEDIRRFSAIATSSSTKLWSFSRGHICANDSSVSPDAKHTSAKQSMEVIARYPFPLAKVASIISQLVI